MRQWMRGIVLGAVALVTLGSAGLGGAVLGRYFLDERRVSVAPAVELNRPDLPWTMHVQLNGPDGAVKETRLVHNVITTAGKNAVRLQVLGDATAAAGFNYTGIGTGDGAGTCASAAAGDTALGSEAGTRQQDTTCTTGATGVCSTVVTFAAGNGTGAICEVGQFNASSAGTMLLRNVFSVVTKAAGDSLQVTVQLTVSWIKQWLGWITPREALRAA